MRPLPRKWVFTHGLGFNAMMRCHPCGKDVNSKNHWPRYLAHAATMVRLFWEQVATERHGLPTDLLNSLVLWVVLGGEGQHSVSVCPMCDNGGYKTSGVVAHLKEGAGDRCFRKMEDLFLVWLGEFVVV